MSANCEIIVIFQIGAIRKLDSERIVSKTYIFINSNLLSYKNWKQKKKSCNNEGIIFSKKCWVFAKNLWH